MKLICKILQASGANMLQYKNVKLQLDKKKVILKTNNIIVRYILWTTKNSSSFENIFTELLEKLNLKIAMLG